MFGSVVIDVVIALTLIFLVFSLVTSGLRELVARVFETRSKELWRSMRSLLDDPIASDLREIRTYAGAQPAPVRDALLAATSTAEEIIRSQIGTAATSKEWRVDVTRALAPLEETAAALGVENELAPSLTAAARRLWIEHTRGRRTVFGLLRAGRRGGERPTVPELPTPATVAELAVQVRRGTKTMTDAIHDHPLVRQVDRTWPGFQSRMRDLGSADFSRALLDIVRAAGVEPTVKTSLADVGRAIDRLQLNDDQKEEIWEPIGSAFDRIELLLIAGTATLGDYGSIVDEVEETLRSTADRLQIPEAAVDSLSDRVAAAHQLVERLHEDPLSMVRAGTELLSDSAPVKNVIERLLAQARGAGEGAFSALAALTGSIEGWYDSRMEAISAWYRKRSRFVAFGLALLVVVAFNVDAIGIPQNLWRNENVRTVVVSIATEASVGLEDCIGSADTLACVEGGVDALVDTGLPLGWDGGTRCDGECNGIFEKVSFAVGTGGRGTLGAMAKGFGWILAAAALAMGASFWYDVLTRATGFKKSFKGERQGATV